MYQPYPAGGGADQLQGRPPVPQSVANAVKLMYAGAVISAIEVIISLTTIGSVKSAIIKTYPHYSAAKVHDLEVAGIAGVVVSGLIGIALWLVVARLNAAGRNWARIVASVLFGINTIELVSLFVQPHALIGILFAVLLWLVGLGAIVMLWHRDSSAYFRAPR
jgi:hypothetical protein